MSARPPEVPEALKIALYGDRHLRTPRNQNLSKVGENLKVSFFDNSSMSTKGFWLTYVKTSFLCIFGIKTQFFCNFLLSPT